jgi:hypothetical protein
MTEITNLICTAGKATRLGKLAGRPIIEWQLDVLGSATIICSPEHEPALRKYGPCVTGVWSGVGASIADALHVVPDGPFTVVYGDTLFDTLPEGSDWIGVSEAKGGRSWDVVTRRAMVDEFCVSYDHVPPEVTKTVCVGLYSLADIQRARRCFDFFTGQHAISGRPWGMGPVLNHYRSFRLEDIPSWRDVGDVASVERWAA